MHVLCLRDGAPPRLYYSAPLSTLARLLAGPLARRQSVARATSAARLPWVEGATRLARLVESACGHVRLNVVVDVDAEGAVRRVAYRLQTRAEAFDWRNTGLGQTPGHGERWTATRSGFGDIRYVWVVARGGAAHGIGSSERDLSFVWTDTHGTRTGFTPHHTPERVCHALMLIVLYHRAHLARHLRVSLDESQIHSFASLRELASIA